MSVEEIKIVRVEHRGERGDLVVTGDEIRFGREREIEVKPVYAPQYTTETMGESRTFSVSAVEAVERSGRRVRVRMDDGDEDFLFEREADAENVAAVIEDRRKTRG